MSLKITQKQRMSKFYSQVRSENFIHSNYFIKKVVSEYGVNEPIFFKSGLAGKKELYFKNLYKSTAKRKK
jgi:hypothetical protein